jgi:polysaccharide biosynthesis/export protein
MRFLTLRRNLKATICILPILISACAGPNVSRSVPRGGAAYAIMPSYVGKAISNDYKIGPLDTLDITVFQEPDLSVKAIPVDASGKISMPLISGIQAAGRTTDELARELRQRLLQYYVHPDVTVVVASSVSQRVTVEGQVEQPGIYDIKGPTTLLNAVALAHGETRSAALREVVVFRIIDSRRAVAVFDLGRIRRGDDPDPEILGNDVVIVGYSNSKGLWRDLLQTAPLLNAFRFYAD